MVSTLLLFLRKDVTMKKIIALILVLSLSFCFAGCEVIDKIKGKINQWKTGEDPAQVEKYEEGLELISKGEYEAAYLIFKELGDFRDSKNIFERFRFIPVYAHATASGEMDGQKMEYTYQANTFLNDKGMPLNLKMAGKDSSGTEIESYDFDYAYDSQGRLIKFSETSKYGTCSYDYSYDEDHNMIQEIYTDEDGEKTISNYTYKDGLLVKDEYVSRDGDTYVTEYTYNSEGDVTYKLTKNPSGTSSSETYKYDSNGNLVKEIYSSMDKSGNVTYTTETDYHYDTNSNVIKEVYTVDDVATRTTDYTYDANGNLIKEKYTHGDYYYTREYTYDANGNMIKYKYSDDDSYYTEAYAYDANGYVVKYTYTSSSGSAYEYAYDRDEYGNVTRLSIEDGGAAMSCDFEYKLVFLPEGITEDMYYQLTVILDYFGSE